MFKMNQASPVRGDCTCSYDIILDKDYTIREFIKTVLTEKSNEWGYIGINTDEGDFSAKIFGDPRCEYKCGRLLCSLPEEYLDKKINKVNGDGGWSRMDYLIWID